jgi:DNA-binding LytR/AlgR family response regulator
MTLKCLIVDDEPASREVLRKYLQKLPGLTLLKECRDAYEASDTLAGDSVDLLFLDINMPGLSGISLAKSLNHPPQIIFTTAYPEYAVEGFELNAADYLVKPFSFERFLKAVDRARERISGNQDKQVDAPSLLVRSEKKIYSIRLVDIRYVEGCGDYIKIVTAERTLLVHDTMKRFATGLPGSEFLRVHKSYIVRLKAIDYLEGNRLYIAGNKIPVSPDLRQELLDRMEQ